MKRTILIALAMGLCTILVAHAQHAVGFESEGPKVGLVLSGGGARGAAHVGVIRLLEELQIPVHYVAGTSMGAIIGALYAIGYTADEMDSLLMSQDWDVLLSNGIPRTMQSYTRRIAKKHYQLNIPYINNVRTENTAQYEDAGIKVRKTSMSTFPKVLARPGLIDGQNLLNEFIRLTYAYHDSVSYDTLPRSFACVAADLVTGEEVVLNHGYLAESVRASMAIPGVFYPIYSGKRVLVDGGVVNNYPVNVARDMGADIIIGVELNTSKPTSSELRSFAAIFERLIGTLGTALHEKNVADTDLLIRPQVKHFPVMGFDSLHLRQLVDIGYAAAQQCRTQLDSLKRIFACSPSDAPSPCSPTSADTATIYIRDISVSGYEQESVLSLLSQHGIDVGGTLSVEELSHVVQRIYGMGTFSSVRYHLTGIQDDTLHFHVVPNPSNQVELGLRFDSENAAAALISIGIDRLKLSGATYDIAARLSINPWLMVRAAYVWPDVCRLNVSAQYAYSDVNRFYDRYSHAFNYHFYCTDIYLSELFSRNYDLRFGTRHDHFFMHDLVRSDISAHHYYTIEQRYAYTALYLSMRNDLFDAAYLPTRGYAYGVELSYHIKNRGQGAGNFGAVQAEASTVVPLGSSTALLPTLHVRSLLGDAIPLPYANAMGGYLSGRYLRQQTPFVGIIGCEFVHRHFALLRLELRQRLIPDTYLSGVVNYAHSTYDILHMRDAQGTWGVGLQLVYDTTLGPLSLSGHWSNLHHRFGAYFSLGVEF